MKKKIITAIVLLVFGLCAIAAGIFGKSFTRSSDVSGFTDDSVGKTVKLCTSSDTFWPIDSQNGIYYTDEVNMCVAIPDEASYRIDAMNMYNTAQTVTGTVRKAPAEMKENAANSLISHYEMMEEYIEGFELTDDDREYLRTSIADYYIEITDTNIQTVKTLRLRFILPERYCCLRQ
ncbi:MAG: hypothetical protein K5665_08470 [Saccharofermentans sp.]|nr:hypothetical protein [Saccharofermentans sp.]